MLGARFEIFESAPPGFTTMILIVTAEFEQTFIDELDEFKQSRRSLP